MVKYVKKKKKHLCNTQLYILSVQTNVEGSSKKPKCLIHGIVVAKRCGTKTSRDMSLL